MFQRLTPAALQMLGKKPKVSIEIDAETYKVMTDLAKSAGGDISGILDKLAVKYQRCNLIEKQMIIHYLNGV